MIKSTSLVFLFLISLASTAQISNTIFSNNLIQQNRISTNASKQRTAAASKQRLDSIVSPLVKKVYIYDPAGNVIRDSAYQRNAATDPWIPIFTTEYGYDAVGNITLTAVYYWDDASNVFFPDKKYEYAYDVNKNQLSEITYSWNSSNNNWFPIQKFENTFGSNGQISKKNNYSWAGTVLMDGSYTVFTYNSKKLLVEETQYSPSPSDFMQSQTIYTYDANDNLISKISSHYDYYNNSEMDSGSKYEYTYDSKNNVTLVLESEWNVGIQDWENTSKTENEFDLQNNQTAIIESEWDNQTNVWVYDYKNVYNYDNSYAITDLIVPGEFGETIKHKLTSFVSYYFANENWELVQEYTAYYKNITTTTGIAHANSTALAVYPNPATDNVIFTNKTNDAATLELFNLQGNLIYKNTITMNQPVSVEGIADGMYLYRISNTNAGSYNGTLIIN